MSRNLSKPSVEENMSTVFIVGSFVIMALVLLVIINMSSKGASCKVAGCEYNVTTKGEK